MKTTLKRMAMTILAFVLGSIIVLFLVVLIISPGNPVLLYLHGGPSFPNYFLIDKYKPGLEEHFTVCYWEQRGGGLSYSRNIPVETMTFEQLTSDAIEVTNYLRSRFGKDKIYLMAHSGGTCKAYTLKEKINIWVS